MAFRLVLFCVLMAAGCMGADVAPPDERPSTAVGRAGVSMQLPAGWRSLPPNDGNVTDPLTRVAISSGPLRSTGFHCHTQITNYAPRRDGVSVVVVEWAETSNGESPLRPAIFDQQALPLRRGQIECFLGDGGGVQFAIRNRTFGAYLLAGEQAAAQLVDEARGALDTLRVEARRG
jgi:hypothetical protein